MDAKLRAANAKRPALAEALSVPQGGLSPATLALGALFHAFGRAALSAPGSSARSNGGENVATAGSGGATVYSLARVEAGLRAENGRQTKRSLLLSDGDIGHIMALLRLAEPHGRDSVRRDQLGRWAAVCGAKLATVAVPSSIDQGDPGNEPTVLPRRLFKAIQDLIVTAEEAAAKKAQKKDRFF